MTKVKFYIKGKLFRCGKAYVTLVIDSISERYIEQLCQKFATIWECDDWTYKTRKQTIE